MLLDLPVWGISCVYWMSVRAASSSPPSSTSDSLPQCWHQLARETACQNHRESRRPHFGLRPSREKESGVEMDSPRAHAIEVKQKYPFLWPVSPGKQGVGGGLKSSSRKDRISRTALKVPPRTHRLLMACCAGSKTFQCWVDTKTKWGLWKEKGWRGGTTPLWAQRAAAHPRCGIETAEWTPPG